MGGPLDSKVTTTYWLLSAGVTALLAFVGAVPMKVAGFALAAGATGLWGDRVLGPALALCLVLPESGGAFPAVLSTSDLVLIPLVLRLAASGAWRVVMSSPRAWALGGLWVAGAVGAVVGVVARGASARAVFFDVYPVFGHMAAFAVAAVAVGRGTDGFRLVRWVIGGGALAALAGIVQVLGGDVVNDALRALLHPFGYPVYGDEAIHERVWWAVRKGFATYWSPNGLGAAAMFGLLLAVALGTRSARPPSRWTIAGAAVLHLGLVSTLSRGAAVGAVVGLLSIAVGFAGSGGRRRAVLIGAAAVAVPALQLALLVVPSPAHTVAPDRPHLGLELKASTASMKVEEVLNTVSMFGHGNVLGAGYGVLWTPRGFVLAPRAVGLSPAYGEIIYRAGLVGAAAVAFAVYAFVALWRAVGARAHAGGDELWAVLRPALLGAAVTSLIDHPFVTVPGLAVVFWATWGVVEALHRR